RDRAGGRGGQRTKVPAPDATLRSQILQNQKLCDTLDPRAGGFAIKVSRNRAGGRGARRRSCDKSITKSRRRPWGYLEGHRRQAPRRSLRLERAMAEDQESGLLAEGGQGRPVRKARP